MTFPYPVAIRSHDNPRFFRSLSRRLHKRFIEHGGGKIATIATCNTQHIAMVKDGDLREITGRRLRVFLTCLLQMEIARGSLPRPRADREIYYDFIRLANITDCAPRSSFLCNIRWEKRVKWKINLIFNERKPRRTSLASLIQAET